ncbi:MAG: hypothetical protein KKA42_12130 [candidate division Zixibacteria bacterium]|nr:hypothetical protein [candidate division Zixibacteria bacterium]
MIRVCLLVGLVTFLVSAIVFAAVPQTIGFQGRLTDPAGTPVPDGSYSIVFSIYGAGSGTPVWTSGAQPVEVKNGLFSYDLGAAVPLPGDVFSKDTTLEVGIKVGSDAELTPRTRLTTTAYAYQALRADTAAVALSAPAGDGGWTDDGTAIHTTTASDWVGIGTSSPEEMLEVDNDESGGRAFLKIQSSHATNWHEAGIRIETPANRWHLRMDDDTHNNLPDTGSLALRSQSSGTEVMVWSLGGNVGINTTTPDERLDVNGNMIVTGKARFGTSVANDGEYAFAAGRNHIASGYGSTISGGFNNQATDSGATVGGGHNNAVTDVYGTVGGGRENTAAESRSTVGGGAYNSANGVASTIAGGNANSIADGMNGYAAVICGGSYNTISAQRAFIGSGSDNTVAGVASAVLSGDANDCIGSSSTILGGYWSVNEGSYSCIAGGERDTLTADADHSFAFGRYVGLSEAYYAAFYDGAHPGFLRLNCDLVDQIHASNVIIRVGTNSDNGNGALLMANGTWYQPTKLSDAKNASSLERNALLGRISDLSISTIETAACGTRTIVPEPTVFNERFGLGIRYADGSSDPDYVSAVDIASVSLAGVQELTKLVERQQALIDQLIEQNQALSSRVSALEGR